MFELYFTVTVLVLVVLGIMAVRAQARRQISVMPDREEGDVETDRLVDDGGLAN